MNFYNSIREAVSKNNLQQEYDQGDKVAVYYDDLYDLYEQLRAMTIVVSQREDGKEIIGEVSRITNRTYFFDAKQTVV